MKRGGRVIYGGKLGEKSQTLIDYFQVTFLYIFLTCIFNFFTFFSGLSIKLNFFGKTIFKEEI